MVDYDKFLGLEIADTGKANLSNTSVVIEVIDYFDIYSFSLIDEENVLLGEQSALRETNYVFSYQTNTRNGILAPRFTIRGVIKESDGIVINKLKTLKARNTIKKLSGGISVIKQDPNAFTDGDRVSIYVQIQNLTFTENALTPDTTAYTLQLQQVNQ